MSFPTLAIHVSLYEREINLSNLTKMLLLNGVYELLGSR